MKKKNLFGVPGTVTIGGIEMTVENVKWAKGPGISLSQGSDEAREGSEILFDSKGNIISEEHYRAE